MTAITRHHDGDEMTHFEPGDYREELALFRAQIIGPLIHSVQVRGDLRRELVRLSQQRFRPPRSKATRTYAVPTLQRWYYQYRNGGLEALKPKRRSDIGHGQDLPGELHRLLLDIRSEYPSVAATVIRNTLVADGRLAPGTLSVSTLRRIYAQHDLVRRPRGKTHEDATQRLRWQAAHPNALWHGDVCHGTDIVTPKGKTITLRIHGLLDDASRKIIALEAHATEKEVDMIGLFTRAIQRHGCPDAMYLDNGATYRGEALAMACGRLQVSLLHAKPYDPQARGKMERFWRTLREGCLDHLTGVTSLHDVNVRLWAFVDSHYAVRPHAGLLGKSPREVWEAHWRTHPDGLRRAKDDDLRRAMTVCSRRRVRQDATLSHLGKTWELRRGFFAGKNVTVKHCLLDTPVVPWVEANNRIYDLHPVDPVANANRGRNKSAKRVRKEVAFDPATALLDQQMGRVPAHKKDKR